MKQNPSCILHWIVFFTLSEIFIVITSDMVEEVMQSLLFVSCLCMYVPVCEQNNSKLWTDLDDIFRVDCLWDMDRVIKS